MTTYFKRTSPLLALILCGFPVLSVLAVESAGPASPTATPAPSAGISASDLRQQLPEVDEVKIIAGKVVWSGPGFSATIISVDSATHDPSIETIDGPLRVERNLIADHDSEVLTHLKEMLDQARAEKIPLNVLRLHSGILAGANLFSDIKGSGIVVLPTGVLHEQLVVTPDRSGDLSRITQCVAKLIATFPTTDFGDIDRRALEDVMKKLDHPDGPQDMEDIKPTFARHLVRHGWLRQWFTKPENSGAALALEQAVLAATKPQAVKSFTGSGMRLEQLKDAFDEGGWILTGPDQVRYVRQEPSPEFSDLNSPLMLAINLPAGSDPMTDAGKAISAESFLGRTPIASWSIDKGFSSNDALWQDLSGNWADKMPGSIPAHILLCDLHGDIAGLLTSRGLLKPVQDSSRPAAEKFLDDAAKMLKAPAELDLIGQYLFTYAMPSPDAKLPELIGNKQLNSNVQQTVWQTCGNVTGGAIHGDCADIAELYETILTRQSLNPIVIGLPEHAACAWAVKKAETWVVDLLQTGPPKQFTDAKLPLCLAKTYKSFDPGMNFDPNSIPLLLRFSGEQSRSEWALSWRIFSDPAYAKTMFDVQRDWHYQTYQRGIATMTKLIADGDDDNANFRELSGLFNFTGQYLKAVEYERKAIDRTPDPLNRLSMNLEVVSFLLAADKNDEAKALAQDVLHKQLPPLKGQLGASYIEFGLRFAAVCANQDSGDALRTVALEGLQDICGQEIDQIIPQVAAWLKSEEYSPARWNNSTQMVALRARLREYCVTGIELLKDYAQSKQPDNARLQALSSAVKQWLDGIAFYDTEEESDAMNLYAILGRWYAIQHGDKAFDELLEKAPMPTAKIDHTKRSAGPAQETRDLSWINASVFYWYGRMADLFARKNHTIDKTEVARLAKHLNEATVATAALGYTSASSEYMSLWGAEIAALIGHDEPALRKILHQAAQSKDKTLLDSAAQWLGDSARFLDMDWYAHVLKAWTDEADYKPKYFWIAWRAALTDAPKQALLAAKIAAERFKDDPSFTEEYQYMRTLLDNVKEPAHQ